MTNIIRRPSVTEIDFAKWHHQHGVVCVLFDIEGTIAEYGGKDVPQGHIDALAGAHDAGIMLFGLVTNMHVCHEPRVRNVADQIGADDYCQPVAWLQSKPNTYMIKQILYRLNVAPGQVGFVGDKAVDMLAAKRAGLACAAWVERLGPYDHPLDRLFYRPLEPILKRIIH